MKVEQKSKDKKSHKFVSEKEQDNEAASSIPQNSPVSKREIPPTGDGQQIYEIDQVLKDHRTHIQYRYSLYRRLRDEIDRNEGGLEAFSRGYEKMGFTRSATGITYREWAPGAKSASLIGDFNNWNSDAHVMTRVFLYQSNWCLDALINVVDTLAREPIMCQLNLSIFERICQPIP